MWQAICLQPGVWWFHLGGLLRCLWIGKELFFTNVSLGHLQLNGTYCLGHENQWTVRFDSRTKPPTSGQFLQNSRALKPMYWTGNHIFISCVVVTMVFYGELLHTSKRYYDLLQIRISLSICWHHIWLYIVCYNYSRCSVLIPFHYLFPYRVKLQPLLPCSLSPTFIVLLVHQWEATRTLYPQHHTNNIGSCISHVHNSAIALNRTTGKWIPEILSLSFGVRPWS